MTKNTPLTKLELDLRAHSIEVSSPDSEIYPS